MKFRRPLEVAAAILLMASVCGPAAAIDSEEGYSLFLFLTPNGGFYGDDLNATIELYRWGVPVDADTLNLSAGPALGEYQPIVTTHLAVGKYAGTFTLNVTNIGCDYAGYQLTVIVRARAGSTNLTTIAHHDPKNPDGGPGGSPCGTRLTSRVLNAVGPEAVFPPGATVQIEAREYKDGQLSSEQTVEGRVQSLAIYAIEEGNLVMTPVATGIFHGSFVLPSDRQDSEEYWLEWKLGDRSWSRNYGWLSGKYAFVMQPYAGFGYVLNAGNTSLTAEFFAGADRPIPGVKSFLGGNVETFHGGSEQLRLQYDALGNDGHVTARVAWGEPGMPDIYGGLDLNDREVLMEISPVSLFYLVPTWEGPDPLYPGAPCQPRIIEDPTHWRPGDNATIRLQVLQDGEPVNDTPVTLFVVPDGADRVALVANRSTESNGSLSFRYLIPSAWVPRDDVVFGVICPNGKIGWGQWEVVGGNPPSAFSPRLSVSASPSHVGGAVHVVAHYLGSKPLTGANAFAWLAPSGDLETVAQTMRGQPPRAALRVEGSTLTGDVQIPDWLPEGDYVVVVSLSSLGASDRLQDEVNIKAGTLAHVGPATTEVHAARFVLDWWFVLLPVVGAALGAVFVRRSLRRKAEAAVAAASEAAHAATASPVAPAPTAPPPPAPPSPPQPPG